MTTTQTAAPLAFIDTETDGVHPGRRVWEVAIVRREPDGAETSWQAFVDIDLSTADPFGLRVGRFYERHPVGLTLSTGTQTDDPWAPLAWPLETTARRVAQLTHGAHLIGAVPSFDADVLDRLLRGERLLPAWHYHLVDVENLAVGYLAAQGRPLAPPWSSQDLSDAVGVAPATDEERHTAMGDVRWAMRIYDAVLGGPTGNGAAS